MPSQVIRVAVLVALLAGWQAALEHPISHVGEQAENHGSLCDELAALAICAPQVAALPIVTQAAHPPPSPLNRQAPRIADAPPFLSQGPPVSA